MDSDICPECRSHFDRLGWNLIGACASVGVETKTSTHDGVAGYLAAYHARGHKQLGGDFR